MLFNKILQETRKNQDMSQSELASAVGISQASISDYEGGKIVPDDIAYRISKSLGSFRLLAVYADTFRKGAVNIPYLNNVDDHTEVGLGVLIEESAELISTVEKLRKLIRNKFSKKDLTEEEYKKILDYELQIIDVMPAILMHLIEMNERYGLNIENLEFCQRQKLIGKGYIKR